MLIQKEFQTISFCFRIIFRGPNDLRNHKTINHNSQELINTDEKPTFPYFFLFKDMQCVFQWTFIKFKAWWSHKKKSIFPKRKIRLLLIVHLIELINNALRDCPETMITWTTMLRVSCGIHLLAVSATSKVYTIHAFWKFIRLNLFRLRVGMSELRMGHNGLSLAKMSFHRVISKYTSLIHWIIYSQ